MDAELKKELKARLRLTEEDLEAIMRWFFNSQDADKLQSGDLSLAARLALITAALEKKKRYRDN